MASQGRRPGGKKLDLVEWAQDNDGSGDTAVLAAQPMGDESTIAQVHPKKLCDAFWEVASKSKEDGGVGSTLLKGKVVNVMTKDDNNKVTGVKLDDGTVVEGDAVLLCCGPWTANLMRGVKYHAVVLPTERTLNQCVFFSGAGDPEVYVRPDQTAYCCGFPDETTIVTEEPGQEEVRPEAVERIVNAVRLATSSSSTASTDGVLSAAPKVTSACYLPTTPDNLPIMGPLSSHETGGGDGCFIATGHGCWGILMGPGTGESMATLIATGEGTDHVNLQPYDPARFQTMRVLER